MLLSLVENLDLLKPWCLGGRKSSQCGCKGRFLAKNIFSENKKSMFCLVQLWIAISAKESIKVFTRMVLLGLFCAKIVILVHFGPFFNDNISHIVKSKYQKP